MIDVATRFSVAQGLTFVLSWDICVEIVFEVVFHLGLRTDVLAEVFGLEVIQNIPVLTLNDSVLSFRDVCTGL